MNTSKRINDSTTNCAIFFEQINRCNQHLGNLAKNLIKSNCMRDEFLQEINALSYKISTLPNIVEGIIQSCMIDEDIPVNKKDIN